MNYERSLDEIIKLSKLETRNKKRNLSHNIRTPGFQKKLRRQKPRKENKSLSRAVFVKLKVTSLKVKSRKKRSRELRIPDARMKIGLVTDARLKILMNRNRNLSTQNRNSSAMSKNNIADARLTIEAHKRKKSVSIQPRNNNFGVTRFVADGIIERKINVNSCIDNGVCVEYEDEDMNLEYETLKKEDSLNNSLVVRRTVQNNQKKYKSPSMHDDRMYFEYSQESPPHYEEHENRTMLFEDLTRTIPNSSCRETLASPSGIINHPKTSPGRQCSYERDHGMQSAPRLCPVSYPSPMARNSYHLVISNLHDNVTGEDIKELFEDVGDLMYAKMIKSGVAEVAYRSQKDAAKAVEIYHNRQLDGMPMKCTLVSRSDESSSGFSEFTSRRCPREPFPRYIPPVNTLSSIEPDSQITKQALFSRH